MGVSSQRKKEPVPKLYSVHAPLNPDAHPDVHAPPPLVVAKDDTERHDWTRRAHLVA